MASKTQLRARRGQPVKLDVDCHSETDAVSSHLPNVVPLELSALPPLLKAEEVATLLRTTRKAVYAMTERAALPGAVHIGRRLLVHRDDLLRWLDERRAPSPGRTRR